MPKMTVRVILKSGVEFSIKCDKFTLTRNGFQQVTGYNIEGITENKPVYLDFEQVAAVVRVFADEKSETDDDGNAADPAPFPSMVVIYNGERVKE